MAPPRTKMAAEDFDNVSLSGNESDSSYDMADDYSPEGSENSERSIAKPASEAPKIEVKSEHQVTYNTPPGVDARVVAQAAWGKDEEQFYDMYSDLRIGNLREELKDNVRSMTALLDGLIGKEPSDRNAIFVSLQKHSRTIASMFGHDIAYLKSRYQDLL